MGRLILSKLLFIPLCFCINSIAQESSLDIYPGTLKPLMLLTGEHFVSVSILYPGLQRFTADSTDSSHSFTNLVFGFRGPDSSELGGAYISRDNFRVSPVASLYGFLSRNFKNINTGLYLGSPQIYSDTGAWQGSRYGLRGALFIENYCGIPGGVSVNLHLDNIDHTTFSRQDSIAYNGHMVKGDLDKGYQGSTNIDLSINASFFPFGRSSTDNKMVLLELSGSKMRDSLNYPNTEIYTYYTGTDSIRIPHSIKALQERNRRYELERGSAGISFVRLKSDHFFLKLSASASYASFQYDSLIDITDENHYYDTSGNFIYEKGERDIDQGRYRFDTSGVSIDIIEQFVYKRNPVTFTFGFTGKASVKLFRNENDPSLSSRFDFYLKNSSCREYEMSLPLSLRWERKNISAEWLFYPAMTVTGFTNHRIKDFTTSWDIGQMSLLCTIRFGKADLSFLPSLIYERPSLNNGEISYRTGRK
jgi:hypothetical protein